MPSPAPQAAAEPGPPTVAEVDRMPAADFVARFGDIAEHSPWVAEAAAGWRPYGSHAGMVEAFAGVVREADPDRQLALLRTHPDLAGRAALAGELAPESRREQAGAGLDRLDADELARFQALNAAYRERFGFPFIIAVKGATRPQIVEAMTARLGNSREEEIAMALTQVCRIIGFRLADRVRA